MRTSWVTTAVAVTTSVAVLLAGCADRDELPRSAEDPVVSSSTSTDLDATDAAQDDWSFGVLDFFEPTLERALARTEAAILGVVERVGPLRWNTLDGAAPRGETFGNELQVRVVDVRIDEVLWSRSAGLRGAAGRRWLPEGVGRRRRFPQRLARRWPRPRVGEQPAGRSLQRRRCEAAVRHLRGPGHPWWLPARRPDRGWALTLHYLSNFDVAPGSGTATNALDSSLRLDLLTVPSILDGSAGTEG